MGYLRFTLLARFNRLRLSKKHAHDVFVCVCNVARQFLTSASDLNFYLQIIILLLLSK